MPNYSRAKIAGFWRAADAATATAAKGKALEDLTCYLFEKVPGVRIARRNVKNAFETEEIDVAIWNEQHPRGLINFNAIILIECKNWSKAVESSEVSWFLTKLENRGLDFGVLIAA
jgi:hypothetical protein